MGLVLVYILLVAFVVLPSAAIYAAVLLVMGLVRGAAGSYFTGLPRILLLCAGAAGLLAALLFVVFGKRLVVK